MKQTQCLTALIIGGGIGGLAAAIALQRVGIVARVYERVDELHEIGAGLTLWANAMRALDQIGLVEPLLAKGVPEGSGGIRTWRGAPLMEMSTRHLEQRYGAKTVAVHRAELLSTLLDALDPGVVRLGMPCVGFTTDVTGVTARFASGETVHSDILIGADGIHSVVRAQLVGPSKPCYAGYTAWRAVAPFEHTRLLPGETWGCGARFGIVPMSQGRVYWFATVNAPEGEKDAVGGRKQKLLNRFGRWHEPIGPLIEATDEAAILRNDIYDRPPLKRWGQGRVTLLGDAAHAMTPNLGQGACQAIEDAVVLAACLRDKRDPISALRHYEARRIPRTTAMVQQARRIGSVGQWEHGLACWLRNALLKRIPARATTRQFDWMMGYQAIEGV